MAERRKLHRAGENPQQLSQRFAHGCLAQGDHDPQRVLLAGRQRLVQRGSQHAQLPGVDPVDVPDHQGALAVEQLTACAGQPLLAGGIRGIEDVQEASRIAPLVHGPYHGQLAGSGLALQREPFIASPWWQPRSQSAPEPTSPGRKIRVSAPAPIPGSRACRLPGSISFTCTPPPAPRSSPCTGRHCIRALTPLGSSTTTAPGCRRASASAACPSSTTWSPGSSTCRAESVLITMSLLSARTIPVGG